MDLKVLGDAGRGCLTRSMWAWLQSHLLSPLACAVRGGQSGPMLHRPSLAPAIGASEGRTVPSLPRSHVHLVVRRAGAQMDDDVGAEISSARHRRAGQRIGMGRRNLVPACQPLDSITGPSRSVSPPRAVAVMLPAAKRAGTDPRWLSCLEDMPTAAGEERCAAYQCIGHAVKRVLHDARRPAKAMRRRARSLPLSLSFQPSTASRPASAAVHLRGKFSAVADTSSRQHCRRSRRWALDFRIKQRHLRRRAALCQAA